MRIHLVATVSAFACVHAAFGQSFLYTAQERSVYAQVSSVSDFKSATGFGPWVNANATAILGNRGAGSDHTSTLGASELYFSGQVYTSSPGAGFTNAKGVFDVTFTLTSATQVHFVWGADNMWNLTLWTPTTTRILATAAQSGKFGDESLFFAAGTYRLRADADVQNGAAGNAGFQLTIVPTPGAVATIGACGLFAARRRRATR
ncbi:MAG: hypothetical protein SFY96_11690 [Planctomycetota bacterium]|nr:hypothetical protein [Planctomycetota bacterium]